MFAPAPAVGTPNLVNRSLVASRPDAPPSTEWLLASDSTLKPASAIGAALAGSEMMLTPALGARSYSVA